jgi:hypothetical protein
LPAPNLKFRRVYPTSIFIGHALGGHSESVYVVEVGNELAARDVGVAQNVRTQLTYLDAKSGTVLHTQCPGYWTAYDHDEIEIPTGEGCACAVAFMMDTQWESARRNGISLKGDTTIELRLLAKDGKLLADVIKLKFSWNGQYGSAPTCKLA